MATIEPIKFGKIHFRPVGSNTIGFMSAGEGFVEISFDPENDTQENSPILTPELSASTTVSFTVENEDVLDLIAGSSIKPEFALEITYKTGKPPRPHWSANLFVWWHYLKDYIQWHKDGKPTFERTITIPNAGVR